jgi:hypothetical protein
MARAPVIEKAKLAETFAWAAAAELKLLPSAVGPFCPRPPARGKNYTRPSPSMLRLLW